MCNVMSKTLKLSSGGASVKSGKISPKIVRDSKTGQFITVRGFGALKDSGLKIKKGVSLMKPIAKQALTERPDTRKAG